jgi:hypothetical protein
MSSTRRDPWFQIAAYKASFRSDHIHDSTVDTMRRPCEWIQRIVIFERWLYFYSYGLYSCLILDEHSMIHVRHKQIGIYWRLNLILGS